MKEKLTEELLKELLNKPNVEDYIKTNLLENITLDQLLNELLEKKSLKKNEVIHKTNLNETHAYQIFSGERKASRNKILQIAFAMNLTLKECDKLLHSAGVSTLYCKNKRDAIIIFCLTHNFSVDETNDELYKFEEDTL